MSGFRRVCACAGGVTVWGAETAKTGASGVVVGCGKGEPGAGAADSISALGEAGVVAGSECNAGFRVATMSLTLLADTGAAVPTVTCSVTVLRSWCWHSTRMVKTPSSAAALAKAASNSLCEYMQRKFMRAPSLRPVDPITNMIKLSELVYDNS